MSVLWALNYALFALSIRFLVSVAENIVIISDKLFSSHL